MKTLRKIWAVLMDYGARIAQLERRIARLEAELDARR